VDHAASEVGMNPTVFRFTGKELDVETGFYYYGARYLDPKTSRWISADPAMYEGDYIPSAPINDEARRRNGNLPGMGGIFNLVNMHVYHYAGNNPIKLTDPDGRDIILLNRSYGAGGFGHNAVLIGNNDDGWILYSKDSFGKNTRQEFKNLGDFVEANKAAPHEDQYDRASWVTTTKDQDRSMKMHGDGIIDRDYAFKEGRNKKTGQIQQNCADLVADIIGMIGRSVVIGKPKIEKGDSTRKGPYMWGPVSWLKFQFSKGNITSPTNTKVTFPNRQFEDFAKENTSYTFDLPKRDDW